MGARHAGLVDENHARGLSRPLYVSTAQAAGRRRGGPARRRAVHSEHSA